MRLLAEVATTCRVFPVNSSAKAVVLRRLGECLAVIASPEPMTAAEKEQHSARVAAEYARHTKPAMFAQSDMFKQTKEAQYA